MKEQDKKKLLVLFGEGLRKIRTSSDLSQEELAERADVDRSYLGGIERGEHNLALINIVKISMALNIPAYKLLKCLSHNNGED